MKFEFHLQNAAANNLPSAKLREQTRMAMVCHALDRLGHEAVVANCSHEFRHSNRWQFFAHLQGRLLGAVQVVPAESLKYSPTDVAFKCSAGWSRDAHILAHCRLAVFHEYDPQYEKCRKLLPVPFMVHDCIIDRFIETGLFDAYLEDDLEIIRAAYRTEKTGVAGFLGAGHYGRKDKAALLPEWCEFRFNDSPVFTPEEYLRWISRFHIGFNMEGETPKSYRFSELTLLGIVNAAPPCVTRITPPLDDKNSILMRDWADAEALKLCSAALAAKVGQADRCYREGWSPTGQARQIVRALECL